MKLFTGVRTAFALGITNLWRIFIYKLGLAIGFNSALRLSAVIPEGLFFRAINSKKKHKLHGNTHWDKQYYYFSLHADPVDDHEPPDWHKNIFNGQTSRDSEQPWWLISDFSKQTGDIKVIWEQSRFDWVLAFTQQICHGDESKLSKLNYWLRDWVTENPPYLGINWKCGQEASIRVIHLAIAAYILDQIDKPEPVLIAMVEVHLKRIAPTISYAIAQNNNHGTSEAAALFIGGSWLYSLGSKPGKTWMLMGRRWLENRARCLIEKDGSFSQYSVNYHRLMLDTFSMVEVWRRELGLSEFSSELNQSLSHATNWLYQFTQPDNGDAPNLGANDGANLLPLSDTDYRDFRPSVQLASVLFLDACAYPEAGSWNLPLQWLDIRLPLRQLQQVQSCQFDDGGYSLLHKGKAFVMINYPRFKFRPSQNDALHVDFWSDGVNLLRDAGSYSYNESAEITNYYGGTQSHNTIQFDDRDQMPRLSRFLLGDWLKSEKVLSVKSVEDVDICGAGYTDAYGASHHRTIYLTEQLLKVEDIITGFAKKAILRWRLRPGKWQLNGNSVSDGIHILTITADIPIVRITLVEAEESRYYLNKSIIPVLEVEMVEFGCIQSEYKFQKGYSTED